MIRFDANKSILKMPENKTSLASLCVGSRYALNVCVGKFLCSMFKAFLGNALNTRR